jgi:uroporphyrinogen-III decarboxylase
LPVPVEVIFNPNWWFRNCGVVFDESFYLDSAVRISTDLVMRRELWRRFGLGEPHPQPRPVIGSQFVAGGFVAPALLGVEVRFEENQAPCPVAANMDRDRAMALRVPDIENTWPINLLLADMDRLEREFGPPVGDFDLDGVLNTALQLRGQQFFVDMLEDPELADHICGVVTETQVRVARLVQARTGTTSISVNRSIVNVDPAIYVHANCSAQMVSPALFRERLLPFELHLAHELRPYGIHHCGNNLHRFAPLYAETGAVFYDVGWGSDVAAVGRALPDAFLNLRLSPVRMLQESAEAIRADAMALLEAAGRRRNVGLCCINMDYGTPEENVEALLKVAREA